MTLPLRSKLKMSKLTSNRLRRSGSVFYLDVKYNNNKGSITSANTMISSVTGQNATLAGREYASVRVSTESIGSSTSGTFAWYPIVPGSVTITNGVETLSYSSTNGTVDYLRSSLSNSVNVGTITLATGQWSLTGTLETGGSMTATYQYNWQTGGYGGSTSTNVPTVNIGVSSATITAEDFPLRADFTLGAARTKVNCRVKHSNSVGVFEQWMLN